MSDQDYETAPGSSAVPDVGELAGKRARVAAAVLCRPEAVLFTYGPDLTDWQVAELAKVGVHRMATGWRFDETVPLRCTGCGAGERFSHALGCSRPGYHPAPVDVSPVARDRYVRSEDPRTGEPLYHLAPPAQPAPSSDEKRREPGCRCHLEEGDSPCPVHPSEDDEPVPVIPTWLADITPEAVARINAIPATGPLPWDIADGSLAAAITGPSAQAPNRHDEIRAASFFLPETCGCGANVAHWLDATSPAAACNGCGAVTQQNVPAVLTSLLDGPGGLLAWVEQQGAASLGLCRLAEVVVRLRAECGRLGEGADHYSARAAELEAEQARLQAELDKARVIDTSIRASHREAIERMNEEMKRRGCDAEEDREAARQAWATAATQVEREAWQRATGADSPAALTKAVAGHRARLRRWFSIPVALRDARLGQLADQLADVRHELSAEDIKAAEALIDLAKGGELSPLDRAVSEVLALLPSIDTDDNYGAINRIIIESHDIARAMGEGGDAALRATRVKIAAIALAGLDAAPSKGGP